MPTPSDGSDGPSTWSDDASEDAPAALPELPIETGYELLGMLGKGAMGQVLLARDRALHREVAIKRIDPSQVSAQLLLRFRAEVEVTAQLDHPGIVPVHSLHTDEQGHPEYVMKVVRGETLGDWLKPVDDAYRAGRELPSGKDLPGRLAVFLDVCDAVAYAHDRGIVHRDLKPDNIMIGSYSQVYVMDWGLAKVLAPTAGATATWQAELEANSGLGAGEITTSSRSSGGGGATTGTRFGSTLGTPAYMAPEQAQNAATVLPWADQFSLGMLLQELVTLRKARRFKKSGEVLGEALLGKLEPWKPRHKGQPAPEDLHAIVQQATAKDPVDRYGTVDELAEDVRRYLRNQPVSVRPDNTPRAVARWVSANSQRVLIGALVLTVVAVGIVAGLVVRTVRIEEQGRAQAALREAELAQRIITTARQAQRIDAELSRYEALLTGLVYASEHALANPAGPTPTYLPPDWLYDDSRPPNIRQAPHYDNLVSAHDADFGFAPGAEPEALADHVQQLASLTPALRAALLDSGEYAARALDITRRDALLLDEGVPLIWSYVASEQGVIVGYPGTPDTYDDGYDPRTRPWYQLAAGEPGPRWSALDVDESNMGLLLTCSMALRDGGQLLGVAGIDLTFGYVIDALLDEDAGDGEVFLVDERGRVIVRDSQADEARTATEYEPAPFPWPEVQPLLQTQPAGHFQEGDTRFVWSRLETVPWSYVLVSE